MTIDWTGEVVDQVDTHWQERLRPRLEGMTDDELFWEPVHGCRSVRPRGTTDAPVFYGSGAFTLDHGKVDGADPLTTSAWRLGHLSQTLASTDGTYLGGPPTDVHTFDHPGTASDLLARLDAEYAAFAHGVRALGDEGLSEPQGHRSPPAFAHAPVARVVLGTSVEVFHNGAEACLLRDLWLRP